MTPLFIGRTLQTTGTLIIGILALRVHRHVQRERRIDGAVARQMELEQRFGWIAVVLVIAGYILEVINI